MYIYNIRQSTFFLENALKKNDWNFSQISFYILYSGIKKRYTLFKHKVIIILEVSLYTYDL